VQKFKQLLTREMDRREFIFVMVSLLVAVSGIKGIISNVSKTLETNSPRSSFGGGKYGI
jgi:hypothetical protein